MISMCAAYAQFSTLLFTMSQEGVGYANEQKFPVSEEGHEQLLRLKGSFMKGKRKDPDKDQNLR